MLLAIGIKEVFGRFGLDLSKNALVLEPRTVVVSLVVGVLVTLAAAYLPARRAGRVPPVAAMRDDVALAESGLKWRLTVGARAPRRGHRGHDRRAARRRLGARRTCSAAGAFGVLVGTALLSPVLGRPVLAGLGWVYRRGFGAVGLMAEQNTLRNPRRTAATASALMIGVSLVTMMAVLGASAKASLDKTLAEDIIADYVVTNPVGQPFSSTVARDIEQVPGVAAVAQVRGALLQVDGDRDFATAVDPAAITAVADPEVTTGSLSASTRRRRRSRTTSRGTRVSRSGRRSRSATPVRTPRPPSSPRTCPTACSARTSRCRSRGSTPSGCRRPTAPSTSPRSPAPTGRRCRPALDAVVADLPTVSVNDQAEFAAEQRQPIDRLLFIVYALLGLAVVIAVLGIVNTLALSVIERIREIGLLRAVGLSRRQLRTMLRLEAVAIALLGAVLGVVVGLAFALALQRSLADDGLDVLAVPGPSSWGSWPWPGWSGCSRRCGPAAAPPASTCSGRSRPSRHWMAWRRTGAGTPTAGPAPRPLRGASTRRWVTKHPPRQVS